MMRYLVLVDRPIHGEGALAQLEALDTAAASFHLVVPVTPLSESEAAYVDRERTAADAGDDDAVVAARWRLRDAASAVQSVGLEVVNGKVGPPDPVEAIERALDVDDYQAVVVVTGRPGVAGWFNLDLPSRVGRHVDVPMVAIEVEPAGV